MPSTSRSIFKIYSGATPTKMLRVSTPSTVYASCNKRLRSPLLPKRENDLRQHIVGMLHQHSKDQENYDMKTGESTVIYQIKKKGDITPIRTQNMKDDKKNESLKRIHLKLMRATRSKGVKAYPVLDGYGDVLNNNETQETEESPEKNHKTGTTTEGARVDSTYKNVRFKIDDNNVTIPFDPLPGYEVRGSAIRNNKVYGYSRSAPTSSRRSESAQRQAQIHTSLQVFKRRLKFNQDNYLAPNSNIRESDYIIRRVPLRLEGNPRVNTMTSAPLEPRLSVTPKHSSTPKTPNRSITPNRSVTPNRSLTPKRQMPVNRRPYSAELSQGSDNQDKKVKFSYRLPEDLTIGKEVSFQDEAEAIPSVNTYVLEQNKSKNTKKYETQATLSAHNLGVHDALTSASDNKVHIGEENEVDHRLVKWVEESTAINYTRKMNRIRSASSERLRSASVESNERPTFLHEHSNDYDPILHVP